MLNMKQKRINFSELAVLNRGQLQTVERLPQLDARGGRAPRDRILSGTGSTHFLLLVNGNTRFNSNYLLLLLNCVQLISCYL